MERYKVNNGSSNCGGSLGVLNLLDRGCLAPLNINSGGSGSGHCNAGDDGDDDDSILSRNLLYRKLPQQRFVKLCILKLDGSLFDVDVKKNATVAELKVAIEELFAKLPEETYSSCISWSHVWGHFCLSYEGQKLVNNKACIKNFGIKDGDQLQFVRHMSVNQSPLKKRLKYQSNHGKCLSPGSSHHQENQQISMNYYVIDEHREHNSNSSYNEEDEEIPLPEFKFSHLLRRWRSYTRLRTARTRGLEGRNHPSRLTLQCLKG